MVDDGSSCWEKEGALVWRRWASELKHKKTKRQKNKRKEYPERNEQKTNKTINHYLSQAKRTRPGVPVRAAGLGAAVGFPEPESGEKREDGEAARPLSWPTKNKEAKESK